MNVIITGSTSGIGRATASVLARDERISNIYITGRRSELLYRLKEELAQCSNANIHILNFDVSNQNEVATQVEIIAKNTPVIDILINNAGLALGTESIQQGNIQDWDTMIDTNVKGMLYMTRSIAPIMIKQGHGHIVNIGSTAGRVMYENGNVYCATKAAVDALGQGMRIDLLPHNIKVTNINPGMVESEFSIVRLKGDKDKAKKVYEGYTVLKPEDIANTISYCINLPQHVCINDLTITCTQQANSYYKYKK